MLYERNGICLITTDRYDGIIVSFVRVCRVCNDSHGLDDNGTGLKTIEERHGCLKWAREANQNKLYVTLMSVEFGNILLNHKPKDYNFHLSKCTPV